MRDLQGKICMEMKNVHRLSDTDELYQIPTHPDRNTVTVDFPTKC